MKLNKIIFHCLFLILSVFGTHGQEEIDLMSYNIGYDEALYNTGEPKENYWVNRRAHQVGLVNFHNPDIIGMQEPHLHQVKYLKDNLDGYEWVGYGREDGKEDGEYNPIFYMAGKFELLKFDVFWLSETPYKVSKSWDAGYTRICTWALFESKETKKQFYVFNTHFDSKGKKARLKSATLINKKITEIVKSTPVFVLGDFNFIPESDAYIEILNYGLNDAKLITKNKPYGPNGTFNRFNYKVLPKYRIDYIYVSKRIEILKYGVLTDSYELKFPSDHLPVLVTAKFKKKQ